MWADHGLQHVGCVHEERGVRVAAIWYQVSRLFVLKNCQRLLMGAMKSGHSVARHGPLRGRLGGVGGIGSEWSERVHPHQLTSPGLVAWGKVA